jgi:dTDP-4-amino-4,6-dideoxygalactose transaminase
MTIPMADPRAQYAGLKSEIDTAVLNVLANGQYGLTEKTAELEQAIALRSGAEFGIALNSGTDALLVSLMALDILPGDEVITTPFTFVATAEVIALLGAVPVFADIDPATFNIDPAQVAARIGARTRAILPVHLFGQMADMAALNAVAADFGLPLIGDAAQAIGCSQNGRQVASVSDLTTLSFYPTKNLGAAGDGGMVLTNDAAVAEKMRYLRFHGSKGTYQYKYVGICSRLDALQTAVLAAKLPRLDGWNDARRKNAAFYDAAFVSLSGIVTPATAAGNVHTFHQYTVRVGGGRRDALRAFLAERGVATGIFYPGALHLQEAYLRYGGKPGDCPHAERATGEVLSLPVMPELTEEQRGYVADSVRAFYAG